LPVSIVFIFFAGVAFLGFAINALFDRIKISYILPLMLIGVLVGPVLHIIDVSPTSTVSQLSPYITAIAIAFILFDVGINMNFSSLGRVVGRASKFTFITQVATGILLSLVVWYVFKWQFMLSLILGFGLSGPSSLIIPAIVNRARMSKDMKTSLIYESVTSDILQLIVPLVLLALVIGTSTGSSIGSFLFTLLFGSVVLGVASALFWLYLLKRFEKYSANYSWMLTISMTIATYGVATQLGLNAALAVFVFGLAFANIGLMSAKKRGVWFLSKLSFPKNVVYIRKYQKEIVFFTSAFFFIYIGLLFTLSNLNYPIVGMALALSLVAMLVRMATVRILKPLMSKDKYQQNVEYGVAEFSMARGLAAAVIATAPIILGVQISGFLDIVFMVILFTNVISTVGISIKYKPRVAPEEAEKQDKQA